MNRLMGLLVVAALVLPFVALSAEMKVSPEFLAGEWVIGSAGSCDRPDTELVRIERDGTFKSRRSGKVESMGFYVVLGDDLELHQLLAPDAGETRLTGFVGRFSYAYSAFHVGEITKDSFVIVSAIFEDKERILLTRCR